MTIREAFEREFQFDAVADNGQHLGVVTVRALWFSEALRKAMGVVAKLPKPSNIYYVEIIHRKSAVRVPI